MSTCDLEIKEFAESIGIPVIITSNHHERALDRIAEAIELSDFNAKDNDIVVNVQGDDPMIAQE